MGHFDSGALGELIPTCHIRCPNRTKIPISWTIHLAFYCLHVEKNWTKVCIGFGVIFQPTHIQSHGTSFHTSSIFIACSTNGRAGTSFSISHNYVNSLHLGDHLWLPLPIKSIMTQISDDPKFGAWPQVKGLTLRVPPNPAVNQNALNFIYFFLNTIHSKAFSN